MAEEHDPLLVALHNSWNVSSFRPCQREALEAALQGRDSLVLLPTGGGKSLCYALFPIVAQKTVLVISPLISLMVDQVKALTEKGIAATFLGSAQDNSSDVSDAITGHMQVVFVTPEKAVAMTTCLVPNIGLMAVDEAHCTAEWGCDFRPEYGALKCVRDRIGRSVPVMALTASATPDVQDHIVKTLGLRDPVVLQTSFDRPNLRFSTAPRTTSNAAAVLSAELTRGGGARLPAIVYVPNVKDVPGKPGVESIARALRALGHRVEHYHGQMAPDERARRQNAFVVRDDADVMVATLAFGMGIDKPNVRLVIHWGACKSIESYFQQAGRAGRDGMPSECVLFHAPSDWPMLFHMARMGTGSRSVVEAASRRVTQMRQYCETTECRRFHLVRHFGETTAPSTCGMCDNCTRPRVVGDVVDYTPQAEAVLLAVAENEQLQFSMTRLTSLLLGDVSHEWMTRLPGYESLRGVAPVFVRGLLDRMVAEGLLSRVEVSLSGYNPFQSFVVGEAARSRPPGAPVLLPPVHAATASRSASKRAAASAAPPPSLSGDDLQCLQTLKRVRTKLSDGRPAYTVATDGELAAIVRSRPKTPQELRAIPGFGTVKVSKYGGDLLAAVDEFDRRT